MHSAPQTIGERNDASGVRPSWADLRDSSCEDFLDSQPAPPPLLHTDSYVETPEPSFDLPGGSVLCNLQAATALGSDVWQPNAAAPEFVPEAGSPPVQAPAAVRHRFRQKRRAPTTGAVTYAPIGKRLRQEEPLRDLNGQRHLNGSEDFRAAQPNSTAPEASAEVTEEDWQRRHDKRTNVVQSIKTTLEYEIMVGLRDRGQLGNAAPRTPDAHDRVISKRKWESLVMHWRNDLRQYTRSQAGPAP